MKLYKLEILIHCKGPRIDELRSNLEIPLEIFMHMFYEFRRIFVKLFEV